ncbi:fungal specific transcription factor domain containing protein [Niveomyces insectorum RCEF 264]|uniref:Fungal specific transcription factor domain containing protein n=1 Tax=Niveomyces insectorum RCEF 264 TaxID=1081102 RepID=A0A167RBD4_9HYPO|nr:fungal specific transcription factor domain containing protein [Niveomyces insectorum RCEF 264]
MASDTQPDQSGRKYRSKKQRPCDLCRSRKIHCKLPGSETVCECCKRLNRVCTFELEPLKRRHRPEPSGAGNAAVPGNNPHPQPAAHAPSSGSGGVVVVGAAGSALSGVLAGAVQPPLLTTAHATLSAASGAPAFSDDGRHEDSMLLEQPHAPMDGHSDAAMTLDMPAFWLSGGGGDAHFFSPPDMSEIDRLLLQSPPNLMPAMEQSVSPTGRVDGGVHAGNHGNAVRHGRNHSHGYNGSNDNSNEYNSENAALASHRGSITNYGQQGGHDVLMPAYSNDYGGDNSNRIDVGLGNGCGLHTKDRTAPWMPPDWSDEFSLESRRGYSNHLIGLSSESDPYLLRYYKYNAQDLYTMFRLNFRRILDDAAVSVPRSALRESNDPDDSDDNNSSSNNNNDDVENPGHRNDPSEAQSALAGYMPVQFALTDETILRDDVKEAESLFANGSGGDGSERDDIALVHRLVPPDLGARLLRLYTRCVHPRFPVLSLADLAAIRAPTGDLAVPVGLLSAVYALAVPFTFLDDELSLFKGYLQVPTDDLWAVAHRSFMRAGCLAHLSLLQLCLLLLQQPPANYAVAAPARFWALSCAALSIAETLGVHLDPSAWRLPRHEVMLRRRLWWLTYTQHVWYAVGLARPCHLHDANWDVDELTADDFEVDALYHPNNHSNEDDEDAAAVRAAVAAEIPIFLAHCRLSVIAADVLKEFYTLRSVRESFSLSVLLGRAQPLRTRIESWRQTLPLLSKPAADLTEDDMVIGVALRLSHLTLEVLIFRALLRPLTHNVVPVDGSGSGAVVPEPMSTIYENCYTCAKVGMEIVAAMKGKHFSTFWPRYTRYQLCYISSFILLSFAQSPTRSIAIRNRELLNKWRDTLRTQSRAWPLARLATIRLNATFWKGLAHVVYGTGPDSPAMMLLRETSQTGQT